MVRGPGVRRPVEHGLRPQTRRATSSSWDLRGPRAMLGSGRCVLGPACPSVYSVTPRGGDNASGLLCREMRPAAAFRLTSGLCGMTLQDKDDLWGLVTGGSDSSSNTTCVQTLAR